MAQPMSKASKRGYKQWVVRLAIPRHEFLKLYQGIASDVTAQTVDGLTVRFPAQALRAEVSSDGVYGTFRLTVDHDNKLQSLRRIEKPTR